MESLLRIANQTKTTAIVKNVLGKQMFEDLCEMLRNKKFSMCADESTDIANKKMLAIVVRLEKDNRVNDFFFGLFKVTAADATTLYNVIVNAFNEAKINYKQNLIGFAADGANNMTGKTHSVAALLK